MRDAIPLFAGLLFPPSCIFCERPGVEGVDLCEFCLDDMPFIEQACSTVPCRWQPTACH